MAHSIQTVQTRNELFTDLDLILVMQLMLREYERSKSTFPTIGQLFQGWRDELAASGPGTIDLCLELVVDRDDGIEEMTRLIDFVKKCLSRFGDLVPAHILNTEFETPGVLFYDVATVRILETLDKIRRLIGPAPDGSELGP